MILTFQTKAISRVGHVSRQFALEIRQRDGENGVISDLQSSATVSSTQELPFIPQLTQITGMLGPPNSETFTLQFVSRDTGKPTIAAVADSLLQSVAHRAPRKAKKEAEEFGVSVLDIEAILEGNESIYRTWHELKRLSIQGGVDIRRQTSR